VTIGVGDLQRQYHGWFSTYLADRINDAHPLES
jgi:hypothetical protein